MLVRTVGEVFSRVRSYVAFVPSFLYSWGLITASDAIDPADFSAEDIDARIAERLNSELRAYDGIAHVGYMSLPKDLRSLLSAAGPILDDATVDAWADAAAAASASQIDED